MNGFRCGIRPSHRHGDPAAMQHRGVLKVARRLLRSQASRERKKHSRQRFFSPSSFTPLRACSSCVSADERLRSADGGPGSGKTQLAVRESSLQSPSVREQRCPMWEEVRERILFSMKFQIRIPIVR
ncbi:hypothetical protein SKAU_G00076010 [Synaphobranchus kaupii]|uniref:Uncharacterized protein n=1 Tax=Synaphobranchus kaupii TaxID=118154 RepID=A0A9Q1G872_SYNKA|nr:hypothetical protein SKAU_G00076010 [Synaphobranchus kaupii]